MSRKENEELYVKIGETEKSNLEVFCDKIYLPPIKELLIPAAITAGAILLTVLILLVSGLRLTTVKGNDSPKSYRYFGWIYGGKPAAGILHCSDGISASVRGWTLYYSDGSVYTGETSGFMKHGSGVMKKKDGSVYRGNFKDDLFSDENATLDLANGDRYEGGFEEGLFSGQGTYYYADGAVYRGGFLKGERSGQGTFVYANGDSFTGTFENDMRLEGTYTWRSGESLSGKYENNQPSTTEKSVFTDYTGKTYLAFFNNGIISDKSHYSPPVKPDPGPGVG